MDHADAVVFLPLVQKSRQVITRSQLYRRSIFEYLKTQRVELLTDPTPTDEPKLQRSEHLYKRIG
jgi:hypothetical protein